MPIDTGRTLAIVAICVACTFGFRLLPFLIFRRGEPPAAVRYLGRVLPMAIMSVLVVYCLKDTAFTTPARWLPQTAALALTAALHLWRRSTFLSICGGTVCYMLLLHLPL